MNRNRKLMNELEAKFSDYNNYETYINKQMLALTVDQRDENTGGGKSNIPGRPTERVAMLAAQDEYIQNCRKYQRAVESVLDELGETERGLVEDRYWGTCSWMTWKEFAQEKHYSTSSMSRLKQKILLSFGRKINRIGKWE